METFELITNRRSIRRYSSQPIREEVVNKILQAGMSGPSCVNARDYAFVLSKTNRNSYRCLRPADLPRLR